MISHDSNFKNLFYDFPRETLQWLLPQAEQNGGGIVSIDFTRQEPKNTICQMRDWHLICRYCFILKPDSCS